MRIRIDGLDSFVRQRASLLCTLSLESSMVVASSLEILEGYHKAGSSDRLGLNVKKSSAFSFRCRSTLVLLIEMTKVNERIQKSRVKDFES